jgi:hypothetical protein
MDAFQQHPHGSWKEEEYEWQPQALVAVRRGAHAPRADEQAPPQPTIVCQVSRGRAPLARSLAAPAVRSDVMLNH